MKGTKELILKTARKLFGKNGITDTSMDDIADEAKIGKGTIYHYYESKEKLFIEVTEKEVEFIRTMLDKAVEAAEGPEGKLRAYMTARCRMIAEIAKVFNLFKEEYLQYYSYVRKVQDKFTDFEQAALKKCLTAGSETGIFVFKDIEFTAFTIGRALHAVEFYFGTLQSQEESGKKAEMLCDIFIGGLKKR
jgi:AcrR family transcriptional regulator